MTKLKSWFLILKARLHYWKWDPEAETAISTLTLEFGNLNSDWNIETAISLLKLGFESWNSDLNIKTAISLFKLGSENWNSDPDI